MPVPWLQIIDAILAVTDLARGRSSRRPADAPAPLARASPGGLETRLAGVVVAALKETFDRDDRRLELEREQVEIERQRAERALKLELLRQAGDREIDRLRLIAGVAAAAWIGTLFFAARLIGGGVGARVVLAAGWLLLLVALALAFLAQSRVSAGLARIDAAMTGGRDLSSGISGALAPWFVVAGLALVGLAVLTV